MQESMKSSAAIALLLCCSVAYAGAWGHGSFDNDDAADWASELPSTDPNAFLSAAFKPVNSSLIYVDAPECSVAIAAAEVVAAARDKAMKALPPDVASWVTQSRLVATQELVAEARSAVNTCLNLKLSELRALWSEGDAANPWATTVADLARRLQ